MRPPYGWPASWPRAGRCDFRTPETFPGVPHPHPRAQDVRGAPLRLASGGEARRAPGVEGVDTRWGQDSVLWAATILEPYNLPPPSLLPSTLVYFPPHSSCRGKFSLCLLASGPSVSLSAR